MKILLISFLFVCCNLYAQQEAVGTSTDSLLNNYSSSSDWHSENAMNGTVSISKKQNEPQIIHNRAELENEFLRINKHIESINFKIESINSNAEEFQIATESGWFEDMERIKVELNNRKIEIQNTLSNN
ncbi:MAG: hypothetical protein QNL61_07630 [Crocinitomicaceae bacterium]